MDGRSKGPDDGFTLFIETEAGIAVRRIRGATPLPGDVTLGDGAEAATRTAAATWGLPDFVFRPLRRARGNSMREIGDAVIIVGDRGLVVQVKARDATTVSAADERGRLGKRIDKAARQAAGTIRHLKGLGTISLENERGHEVSFSTTQVDWVPVVVIDHPGLADYIPTVDAVVLLRRDWEFLFEQLKSTWAVAGYLDRVYDDAAPIPLGDEPLRYYELAEADADAAGEGQQGPLHEYFADLAVIQESTPLLPREPAGFADSEGHIVVRAILEDIACASYGDAIAVPDILTLLATVDQLDVGYRSELGRTLLGWLVEVSATDRPLWRYRMVRSRVGGSTILFGVTRTLGPMAERAWQGYVFLRHTQLLEAGVVTENDLTVGLLLTPRAEGSRGWDTTLVGVRGDLGLTAESREAAENIWGRLGELRADSPPTR